MDIISSIAKKKKKKKKTCKKYIGLLA